MAVALASALASALVVAVCFAFLGRDPDAADVRAVLETSQADGHCADSTEPAIWVHPTDPELSLILGAGESGGLAVFDLAGQMIQCLSGDRIGAVDLRTVVTQGGRTTTLVLCAETEHEQLVLFTLNAETRSVEELPDARFNVSVDPEKICLYQSASDGTLFAFVAGKDHEHKDRFFVEQYQVVEPPEVPFGMRLVRRLELDSQVGGLVADDLLGQLYVAERDVGIFKYGVDPNREAERLRVDSTGLLGRLFGAVDGLTLCYGGAAGGYLIASSPGSEDFVVYRRLDDNRLVGRFEIISADGIDAVTKAGGIDVVAAPLGGRFSEGLFVCGDAEDDDGDGSSNFKLVAWRDILVSLAVRS